jgi:hypothetical protein
VVIQIFKTAVALFLATWLLISIIGGEADENWKEWLATSVIFEILIALICVVVIIWQ